MLSATISGSFHRHLAAIYTAVAELRAAGVTVLSPSDPRVVDHLGEFLFVASDRLRSVKLVQDRHLQCIGASAFLWLVAPDGYVGTSASMEIGYAVAARVPIFCTNEPNDVTLKEYISVVPGIHDVLCQPINKARNAKPHLLLDPPAILEDTFRHLDQLRKSYKSSNVSQPSGFGAELQKTKRHLITAFGD